MQLCSFTLVNSPSLTCQVSQNLVSAYGTTLKISLVDPDTARIVHVHSSNQFAQIVKIFAVGPNSFCVLSDSGAFSILSYSNNKLTAVSHNFLRSGLRRATPCLGACDPQQRVCLIAALDSKRYAYVLGIDSAVSGPIECSTPNLFCYHLVALNVGYSNPLFCQIEALATAERHVAFYEFNLGLNLLQPKQKIACPTAYLLCTMPQGVLVFREGFCDLYGRLSVRPVASLPVPGVVSCATTHTVKLDVFTLFQTADGKLYKIDHKDEQMTLKLFGQAPAGAALHLFKSGFLYVASQQTDHALYQFTALGEEDEIIAHSVGDDAKAETPGIPSSAPDNLELVDTIVSLARSTCLRLGSARSKVQSNVFVGAGQRFRNLSSGLQTQELVSSPLGSTPLQIFVTGSPFSKLIVIAFESHTKVLEVSDSVKETSLDLAPGRTLGACEIDGVLVQVHTSGIRQLFKTPVDWVTGSPVVACCLNRAQVIVALADGHLIYFEQAGGALKQQFKQKVGRVTALCLPETPEFKRADWALAGIDDTLRVFSLEAKPQLVAVQQLSAAVSGLLVDNKGVHVGLQNGVYMISQLADDGALTESKQRYMGAHSVEVHLGWFSEEAVRVALVKCGAATWASFSSEEMDLATAPAFDAISTFHSEDISQALVAANGPTLRIFLLENSKSRHASSDVTLATMPRAIFSQNHILCVGGVLKDGKLLSFEAGMTAVAAVWCKFDNAKEFFCVGLLSNSRYERFQHKFDSAWINVYDGEELVHATRVPNVSSLVAHKGRLVVGCNNKVIAYGFGTKQLLRKHTLEINGETRIVGLASNRNRLYIAGSRRSITVFASLDNGFVVVADDAVARPVSSFLVLDYDTIAIGDRFGGFSVLRVPRAATDLCGSDTQLQLLAAKPGRLNGAHFKLDLVSNYYLGDVVVGMQLGVFTPGGVEVLMWLGVNGTLGIMAPVDSGDYAALRKLEVSISGPSLLNRTHSGYRGSLAPALNVVDGDLCVSGHSKEIVELRARCI